ncbi:MAG TPA: ShlB/FhaC/HecB family hemolysin secretion/activation protein [Gammaproteobacteria bacterium]
MSAPAAPTPAQQDLLDTAPTNGQIQSTLPSIESQQPLFKVAPLANLPSSSAQVPPGGPTVAVTAFDITGNTVFDTATLQALIASYTGKDLTLAEIYKAADVITRYYQDHGYGIARATLPEQRLSEGRVRVQVVEGRIGKVSVEGNTRTRTGAILNQATAIKSGDVFTDSAMDRAALLVNDLPALQAQAVLEPGSEFGTADLIYKVQEDSAYTGLVSVDDYGRPDVGRMRLNAEVSVASPTDSGDRLIADVTHSEDDLLNFGSLSYVLPLGPDGGKLNASWNQSRYHVTGAFAVLGLRGTGKNGALSYLFPEIRGRASSLIWGVGIQHEAGYSSATITGEVTDPITHKTSLETNTFQLASTNLNLVDINALYVHAFEDGSTYNLAAVFSSNGRHNHGENPGAQRAKFEFDAGYQLPFDQSWTFTTKGSSVWSPDPLADAEKFSLGGPDNLRGYPSADARGDAGFYGSLELQRSFAPLPISVGGFFDAGRAWERHFDTAFPRGTVTTPPEVHTLESVGADLTYESSDKRWEGRLEWAYAVGYAKPSDGNTGGHIWATFGMNF